MLVSADEPVVVQGITGKQGRFWTSRMRESGTSIAAGTNPGRGGQEVDGIPVYDCIKDAIDHHQIAISVLFVPPLSAKAAALDALTAGISKLVFLTEHVPLQDVMEVLAEARQRGATIVGPNTAGVVVPAQASVGIMPAHNKHIFQPGTIGVISRSGSLGVLICLNLVSSGYGQSAFIGIGGDPILGTTTVEALRLLDQHPGTDAVVIVGEIGGSMEEEAAAYAATMSKPVVAFIAGRTSPPGRRMGHAGAIVGGGTGAGEDKVRALADAGVAVIELPFEVGDALLQRGIKPARTSAASEG